MTRLDDFLRMASRRMSRRQAGVAGATLLALLTGADLADARKRKRNANRDRPQRSQGEDAKARRRRRCGGIAGIPCPDGFTCVDDPRDDCDPKTGGADCIGICVRKVKDPCATVRCREGTRCCPQCGRACLPLPEDVPCSEDVCSGEPCNETTCGAGEYCCNESCSLCVPLGRGCTRQICPPKGKPCGGIAGLPCPEGFTCVDDPRDDCSPETGGADCIGICVRKGTGAPCGRNRCGPGEYCCNPSCGICADPGMSCIMIACPEDAVE